MVEGRCVVTRTPSYPNWQRKRIQNPSSVSSSLTEGTLCQAICRRIPLDHPYWPAISPTGEAVLYPTDATAGQSVWCLNAKHGTPATLVCTGRHDQGQRWQARWVGDGQERSKSFAKKADAEAHVKQDDCRRIHRDLGKRQSACRPRTTFAAPQRQRPQQACSELVDTRDHVVSSSRTAYSVARVSTDRGYPFGVESWKCARQTSWSSKQDIGKHLISRGLSLP